MEFVSLDMLKCILAYCKGTEIQALGLTNKFFSSITDQILVERFLIDGNKKFCPILNQESLANFIRISYRHQRLDWRGYIKVNWHGVEFSNKLKVCLQSYEKFQAPRKKKRRLY